MIQVAVLGATGMVGQHYVALLQNHPWFKIALLAASERSFGKRLSGAEWFPKESLKTDWELSRGTLEELKECDLVFSCMGGGEELEEALAASGVYVISHNASHRTKADVPLIVPEINANQLQNHRLIAKPNCAIQSYVMPLAPLRKFGIERVTVTTLQSLSGAGKKAMKGEAVVPHIPGEEEKCQTEPQRVLERIFPISATCMRVPIPYGHYASVSVAFAQKPSEAEIIDSWKGFAGLDLPTAPKQPLHVDSELDVWRERGMAVSVGRLRPCPTHDWQFACASHNVLRGAAGGGLLTAEYIANDPKSPLSERLRELSLCRN